MKIDGIFRNFWIMGIVTQSTKQPSFHKSTLL